MAYTHAKRIVNTAKKTSLSIKKTGKRYWNNMGQIDAEAGNPFGLNLPDVHITPLSAKAYTAGWRYVNSPASVKHTINRQLDAMFGKTGE